MDRTTRWTLGARAYGAWRSEHHAHPAKDATISVRDDAGKSVTIPVGHWALGVRQAIKAGQLTAERMDDLARIGFEPADVAGRRQARSDALLLRSEPAIEDPAFWVTAEGTDLARDVRAAEHAGWLTDEVRAELNCRQYIDNGFDLTWLRMAAGVRAYLAATVATGETLGPRTKHDGEAIGSWYYKMRLDYERGGDLGGALHTGTLDRRALFATLLAEVTVRGVRAVGWQRGRARKVAA